MITLQQVSVRFGGLVALDGLCLSLSAPAVGVIGPNGAGKSTLLDALCGLVPLQPGGRLSLHGERFEAWPPHRRARAGLRRCFQAVQLAPERSVADNVAVMLDALPMSAAGRATALQAALAFTGLSRLQHQACGALSPFPRRCVELARALAGTPRLLLLDEPAAGLDAAEREALCGLLARIPGETGAQLLLVDHDIDLVARCCRQLLVLEAGRVLALGDTAQVLASPTVRAACLGEVPPP